MYTPTSFIFSSKNDILAALNALLAFSSGSESPNERRRHTHRIFNSEIQKKEKKELQYNHGLYNFLPRVRVGPFQLRPTCICVE